MKDNRTTSRLMVSWNAAFRLPSKQIISAKIMNLSSSGVQFLCSEHVQSNHKYEMQITVPDINGSASTTMLPCFIDCSYSILSGSDYRVGAKLSGLSPEHNTLIARWIDKLGR